MFLDMQSHMKYEDGRKAWSEKQTGPMAMEIRHSLAKRPLEVVFFLKVYRLIQSKETQRSEKHR